MLRTAGVALLVFSCSAVEPARAQAKNEDAVVLNDGTLVRGTITDIITPGSAVSVRRSTGRITSLLWSEILTIRRVPVDMPDSLVAVLCRGTEQGSRIPLKRNSPADDVLSSPFGLAAGDTAGDDILILKGGTISRGSLLSFPPEDSFGLWTKERTLRSFRKDEVRKAFHAATPTSDSLVDVTYINPLPGMIADDFRVLTLFGGCSIPAGEFASPRNESGAPTRGGPAFGLHASLRLFPTIRWASDAIICRNPARLPSLFTDYTAGGSPGPHQLVWILTGAELRTEGTAAMKTLAFIQGGVVFSSTPDINAVIPLTFNHPSGSGWEEGSTSTGFALCMGGGFSIGRLSLTGRWLMGWVSHVSLSVIYFGGYGPVWEADAVDHPVNVFLVSAGISPF